LGNMRFRPIADILDFLNNPLEVMISRCAIGGVGFLFGDGNTVLKLVEIEENQDFMSLLDYWIGNELSFISCLGFNDGTLDELSSVEDGDFVCPDLLGLSIIDCPDFSVAALKRLVSARRAASKPIRTLVIGGRAPYFSIEDKTWFEGSLECSFYNPDEQIYGSYDPPSPTL
jgi:hypothetical protein